VRQGSWALALALAGPGIAAAQEPPSVLVVDAAEPGQPERIAFQEAFEEALQAPTAVTVHAFNLDLWRLADAATPRAIDARVRERYLGVKMAVIVALTDPAIEAALRWRDALWPGVPVLCLQSADEDEAAPPLAAPQVTVIRAHADPAATLRAALSLFPETKSVAILGGAEIRGRPASTLAASVRALDARLKLIELVGLPMPELKRRLAALPPQTIVLSAGIKLDGRGRRWLSADAHDYLARSARAPIFSVHEGLIGHGVVGGVVLDYEALGREAAERTLRLLAGEPALSIQAADTGSMRPQFDHRELERWGIADDRLPAGSEIVFRPPSFWEEHRGKVVAAGVALLLQSLAITSLLLERRRRRAAEGRLRQLSGRLITAQEEERSRIARDLHDDAGQRLALLAIELDQLQARSLADQARALSADLHRMAHQLHPAILDQLGLLPAARRFAGELAARHGLTIEVLSDRWPETLPRDAALVLYRVMQEALQNAVKHSGAARVEIAFRGGGDELTVRVADRGRGFAPEQVEGAYGLGLAGMRERLRIVGGGLRIESAPGGGTMLEAWLPVPVAARGVPRVADAVPDV
jgi:signal transduction histidine kinase